MQRDVLVTGKSMRIHTYQCLPGAAQQDEHCAARGRAGPPAAESTDGNLAALWSVVAGRRATLKMLGKAGKSVGALVCVVGDF